MANVPKKIYFSDQAMINNFFTYIMNMRKENLKKNHLQSTNSHLDRLYLTYTY